MMKMRSVYVMLLSAALLMAVAVLSSCRQESPADTPVVVIASGESMQVSAKGGRITVSYGVLNTVEGGSVRVEADKDWISEPEYTSGTSVSFLVEPNPNTENRNSLITITYEYDGSTVHKQLNLIQLAADYALDATCFSGIYYGTRYGNNGEHNWYVWLSDKPFKDGTAQPGGTYYALDLYAGAPDDDDNPLPPAGIYTHGEDGSTGEMTFSDDSRAFSFTEDGGSYVFNTDFMDGTLTLVEDGQSIDMTCVLTDKDGKIHIVAYSGPAECSVWQDEPAPGIDGDIDIAATYAEALYQTGNEDQMQVQFSFTDMYVGADGAPVPPGSILTIVAWMPFNEDGKLAAGPYEVSPDGEVFTIVPGKWYIDGIWATGSYVTDMGDAGTLYAVVESGTMTVKETSAGVYSIECDMVMDNGFNVTCTWSGAMEVYDVPGPFSTLTSDYTLNLENSANTASYYGDTYQNGTSRWRIQLVAPSGDGVDIELAAEGLPYEDGLPAGEYTASTSYVPQAGQYVPGSMSASDGALSGTLYLSGRNESGQYTRYAPAISGELSVLRNTDGTYVISFEFLDDRGYIWDGQWSGNLNTMDYSGNSFINRY